MWNIVIWIGAVTGLIGLTICIVFWGSKRFMNHETRWTVTANCALILYVVCAYLILKPILFDYFNSTILI